MKTKVNEETNTADQNQSKGRGHGPMTLSQQTERTEMGCAVILSSLTAIPAAPTPGMQIDSKS